VSLQGTVCHCVTVSVCHCGWGVGSFYPKATCKLRPRRAASCLTSLSVHQEGEGCKVLCVTVLVRLDASWTLDHP